jgi:hypothetical protein
MNLEKRLGDAIAYFWKIRTNQFKKGKTDQGGRKAVTGGAHCDGFVNLVAELLAESGIPDASIVRKRNVVLPGFFRPTKQWDLLVVVDRKLLAAIEFKSQVGPSFGNNYNNRTEEALGNATDIHAAYREGAFRPSESPWLGYLFLLEDCNESKKPVAVDEPHFRVFPEFQGASYSKRYEILCQKLVRERLYDSACFLMSSQTEGLKGKFYEPSEELSFRTFAASLMGRAQAYARLRK